MRARLKGLQLPVHFRPAEQAHGPGHNAHSRILGKADRGPFTLLLLQLQLDLHGLHAGHRRAKLIPRTHLRQYEHQRQTHDQHRKQRIPQQLHRAHQQTRFTAHGDADVVPEEKHRQDAGHDRVDNPAESAAVGRVSMKMTKTTTPSTAEISVIDSQPGNRATGANTRANSAFETVFRAAITEAAAFIIDDSVKVYTISMYVVGRTKLALSEVEGRS